eukprot:4158479-Karenia_brevis.AAC.1
MSFDTSAHWRVSTISVAGCSMQPIAFCTSHAFSATFLAMAVILCEGPTTDPSTSAPSAAACTLQ